MQVWKHGWNGGNGIAILQHLNIPPGKKISSYLVPFHHQRITDSRQPFRHSEKDQACHNCFLSPAIGCIRHWEILFGAISVEHLVEQESPPNTGKADTTPLEQNCQLKYSKPRWISIGPAADNRGKKHRRQIGQKGPLSIFRNAFGVYFRRIYRIDDAAKDPG